MKATPFLNDPALGWQHDLPGPDDIDSNFPESEDNIIYLEFKIDTFKIRGLLAWLEIILIISSLILQQDTLALFSDQTIRFDIWIFSIASLTCAGAYGAALWRFVPTYSFLGMNLSDSIVPVEKFTSTIINPIGENPLAVNGE